MKCLEKISILAWSSTQLKISLHLSLIVRISSIFWSGHLVHRSIPSFNHQSLNQLVYKFKIIKESLNHIIKSYYGSNSEVLTFMLNFNLDSRSLNLPDISHHHLSIGLVTVWSSHLYLWLYKRISYRIKDLYEGGLVKLISKTSYMLKSSHIQLGFTLALLGSITSQISQVLYVYLSYTYLNWDGVYLLSIYIHHC